MCDGVYQEESPVKPKPSKAPTMEMHDDEEFEKLLANMDAKQPAKKVFVINSSVILIKVFSSHLIYSFPVVPGPALQCRIVRLILHQGHDS